MKHYVFLRLAAGEGAGESIRGMERGLAEAQSAIPGFERYQVLTESSSGAAPSSVLIVLSFASSAEKDNYLQHPLHLALLQQIKPIVMEKAAFDGAD